MKILLLEINLFIHIFLFITKGKVFRIFRVELSLILFQQVLYSCQTIQVLKSGYKIARLSLAVCSCYPSTTYDSSLA